VGIAFLEPEELRRVQTGVHARQDGDMAPRGHWEFPFRELLGVALVGGEQFRHNGHRRLLCLAITILGGSPYLSAFWTGTSSFSSQADR